MDYKVGDVVIWNNDITDKGIVIHVDSEDVAVRWHDPHFIRRHRISEDYLSKDISSINERKLKVKLGLKYE